MARAPCPSQPSDASPLACAGPVSFLPSQVGVGLPYLSVDTVAQAPSRRSLDPVDFLQMSLASERRVSPTAPAGSQRPYQLLMRPCLGSQTGSFLQPRSPSPLWSQKKVISLREDFLGALPIFHTKSPGRIFHGRHLQIGAAARIRRQRGGGPLKGANGCSN